MGNIKISIAAIAVVFSFTFVGTVSANSNSNLDEQIRNLEAIVNNPAHCGRFAAAGCSHVLDAQKKNPPAPSRCGGISKSGLLSDLHTGFLISLDRAGVVRDFLDHAHLGFFVTVERTEALGQCLLVLNNRFGYLVG